MFEMEITEAEGFRVGMKVRRGNGKKILTITAMYRYNAYVVAKLNKGCVYKLSQLHPVDESKQNQANIVEFFREASKIEWVPTNGAA